MNRYSTLGNRCVALIIDLLVISPVIIFSVYLEGINKPDWMVLVWIPIEILIITAYTVLLHWKYGQTFGKMSTRVKVMDVSEGPEPLSLFQAFLRDIAYVVDGLIWVAFAYSLYLYGIGPSSEEYASATQYLFIPILIWFIGDLVVCLRSPKRRALHDLIAGTVVVRLDVPAETEALNHTPPPPDYYKEVMS